MIVRLTLAALFVVPAAMSYPWDSTQDRWLLGVAIAAVVILFAWWRGLFVTTMIGRRIAILTGRSGAATPSGEYATVALRIEALGAAELPLSLAASYLDRYGISFDKVRLVSRDNGTGRSTWMTLSLGAADNVAALTARSPQIPLRDTAQLTARRLADHLRELGWDVSVDDAPRGVVTEHAKETWRGLKVGDGYLAAYRVSCDERLAETLDAVRASGAAVIWTAVEFTGSRTRPAISTACALHTGEKPAARAPLPGLTPERGKHRAALTALEPASDRRLPAVPVAVGAEFLARQWWPAGEALSRT